MAAELLSTDFPELKLKFGTEIIRLVALTFRVFIYDYWKTNLIFQNPTISIRLLYGTLQITDDFKTMLEKVVYCDTKVSPQHLLYSE